MNKAKKKLHKRLKNLWKIACLAKWGNRCECCGKSADHFHHYVPVSKSLVLRYDVENGVPMCNREHYLIHFSNNPAETHRLCEIIRNKRGKDWCDYIDSKKKQRGKNSLWWLRLQEQKLCG